MEFDLKKDSRLKTPIKDSPEFKELRAKIIANETIFPPEDQTEKILPTEYQADIERLITELKESVTVAATELYNHKEEEKVNKIIENFWDKQKLYHYNWSFNINDLDEALKKLEAIEGKYNYSIESARERLAKLAIKVISLDSKTPDVVPPGSNHKDTQAERQESIHKHVKLLNDVLLFCKPFVDLSDLVKGAKLKMVADSYQFYSGLTLESFDISVDINLTGETEFNKIFELDPNNELYPEIRKRLTELAPYLFS